MTSNSPFPTQANAERAAFLRGIEHRGRVLAAAQCGDVERARSAVAAGKIGFNAQAEELDPTQWETLFWQSLLAQAALRAELRADPRDPFSLLAPGPRAALLLRLVAELDQVQAADVLGVTPATYRHALYRAMELLRGKGIDESVLHLVRDSLQRDAQPTHATPIVSAGPEPVAGDTLVSRIARARSFRPVLIAGTSVLLLMLVTSFFWLPESLRPGVDTADGFQVLHTRAPSATLSATATAISGSDFGLLADPQGERVARDLDLYAWYAATANLPATGAMANNPLPETTLPETAAAEADAEDPLEGTSTAADSALPIVAGHPVAGHPGVASSKDSDAH